MITLPVPANVIMDVEQPAQPPEDDPTPTAETLPTMLYYAPEEQECVDEDGSHENAKLREASFQSNATFSTFRPLCVCRQIYYV